MNKTYFISDLHFNHKNILKYEPSRIDMVIEELEKKYRWNEGLSHAEKVNKVLEYLEDEEQRKFILEVHNECLIRNWNKVVKPEDTVWFLGDLAMGNKANIKDFIKKLNGHKRMIMGNHDNLPLAAYLDGGFEYVSKYPIILKDFFVLSHAPLAYMNDNMPFFNIYGHVHGNSMYNTHTEHSQCVCVERQNFRPIQIEEFDKYIPETKEY